MQMKLIVVSLKEAVLSFKINDKVILETKRVQWIQY